VEDVTAASAAALLPGGVGLLDPERAVFDAMIEGWRRQMVSRGLKASTVKSRLDLIRRFGAFTNDYPWAWEPEDIEGFSADLLGGPKPCSTSTARNYQNEIRLFTDYLLDPRYRWVKECQQRFGRTPQAIVHEWNSIGHVGDYEGDPARRALTVDEVQDLFDAADDLVAAAVASKRKGRLAATRTYAVLKTTYAFGLRRNECRMLDRADMRRNPKAPAFGDLGALQVRYGKSSRGSAAKRRTVLLVPEMDWVLPVMDYWLAEVRPKLGPMRHPAVWLTERGTRISVRLMDEAFDEVSDHAGLPSELTLHSLRHSYVTHLLEFGYPELFVQKQVGHSYAATTAIYAHVSDEYRTRLMQDSLDRQMAERGMEGWTS